MIQHRLTIIKCVSSSVKWDNNYPYPCGFFTGLNKIIFTKNLVSLVSRKDSNLVVLILVPWTDGKRRHGTKGKKLSKGRRDIFHKGEKNAKRIEKFRWHVMNKIGQTSSFAHWRVVQLRAVESMTHRERQCSMLPLDGSIEPLPVHLWAAFPLHRAELYTVFQRIGFTAMEIGIIPARLPLLRHLSPVHRCT